MRLTRIREGDEQPYNGVMAEALKAGLYPNGVGIGRVEHPS